MEQYCSIPLTYTDPLSDHYCSDRRSLLLHTPTTWQSPLEGQDVRHVTCGRMCAVVGSVA